MPNNEPRAGAAGLAWQEGAGSVANPRDARITVIGGGAIGAAAAYFLARAGYRDIQLLDRQGLCEATSSQAAGRRARPGPPWTGPG